MLEQSQDVTMQNVFQYKRRKYNVQLKKNEIVLVKEDSFPSVQIVIPTATLIAVHPKDSPPLKIKRLTIYFAKRKKKNKWKLSSVTLRHMDGALISLWAEVLQNYLNELSFRPKRVLLCINPYGGRKIGMRIYKKVVKPLFNIAKIEADVMVSQKRNQIRDYLLDYNFQGVQAVVCVGGDGTVSEVINGLVLRECRLQGIDPNAAQQLPAPTVPLGIIPSGSTDCTVYCIHGTLDAKTAVLHIIMGKSLGLDLVAAYADNRLVQIYADIASYGYLGDVVYHSEELRWMGPTRYEYAGFKKIMENHGYNGKLIILSDENDCATIKCYEDCPLCDNKRNVTEGKNGNRWTTVEGKFFLIAGANMSCAGDRNPNGLLPYCHLGDGHLNLLVIRHTSLFTSLRTLQRFTKSSFSINDLAHVEVYKAKEFYFYSDGASSKWSCDGEIIHHSNLHAKVHHQLINVFGRGISNVKLP